MPEPTEIVINTSPLIALTAATGNLEILKLYNRVWIPYEVGQEIINGRSSGLAVPEFAAADWERVNSEKASRSLFGNETLFLFTCHLQGAKLLEGVSLMSTLTNTSNTHSGT